MEEVDNKMAEGHKAVEIEEFEMSNEDALTLQLLQTKAELAQAQLQMAAQAFNTYKEGLVQKYSEGGKYKLVGDIDLSTRKGQRIISE